MGSAVMSLELLLLPVQLASRAALETCSRPAKPWLCPAPISDNDALGSAGCSGKVGTKL